MIVPKLNNKLMKGNLFEEKISAKAKQITGQCKHKIYFNVTDPCARCAFCTIDGNDYTITKEKPPAAVV